jgi:hypothetical protein
MTTQRQSKKTKTRCGHLLFTAGIDIGESPLIIAIIAFFSRQYVKSALPWFFTGLMFCGQALSGEQTTQFFQKQLAATPFTIQSQIIFLTVGIHDCIRSQYSTFFLLVIFFCVRPSAGLRLVTPRKPCTQA